MKILLTEKRVLIRLRGTIKTFWYIAILFQNPDLSIWNQFMIKKYLGLGGLSISLWLKTTTNLVTPFPARSDVFTIAFLYTSTFPTYYFNPFFHKVFGIEWRCSQANRSCWPVEVAGLGGWGEGGVGVGVNFIFSWLPSISWKVAIETNQRGIFTLAWWISLTIFHPFGRRITELVKNALFS